MRRLTKAAKRPRLHRDGERSRDSKMMRERTEANAGGVRLERRVRPHVDTDGDAWNSTKLKERLLREVAAQGLS